MAGVKLQGEGGSVFEFSLPLSKAFAEQVRKGRLTAADEEAAKALAESGVFAVSGQAVEAKASEEPAESGKGKSKAKPSTEGGPPPKVGKGSGRDAWAAYAESIGIDISELGGRAEIIKAVEAKASE